MTKQIHTFSYELKNKYRIAIAALNSSAFQLSAGWHKITLLISNLVSGIASLYLASVGLVLRRAAVTRCERGEPGALPGAASGRRRTCDAL